MHSSSKDGREESYDFGGDKPGAPSDFCLDFQFFPKFPAQASLITHPSVAVAWAQGLLSKRLLGEKGGNAISI